MSNKFIFGGFKQQESDLIITNSKKQTYEFVPLTTYYANCKIFSQRSPRRWPRQVDKLSTNVFNDE